jgi:thiol-disulfide isomerase/thioredoxin
MNKIKLLVFLSFIGVCSHLHAQDKSRKLPEVMIKDMTGKTVKSTEVLNTNGITVIDFWATWCKPCILELDNIAELYPKWQKETGVKIIAVTIDDARNASKVAPFVKGRDWTYDVYLDENSDFKRALNVGNIPHTFLLNKNGEIIWQHNSYAPGDEEELYELIKKEAAKQ